MLCISIVLPSVAYGEATIDDLLVHSIAFVNGYLIYVAFAATFLFFLYGIARYILASGDDAKVAGRQLMIWGSVAMFIVSSIWGLVAIINRTLGLPGQPEGTIRATCVHLFGEAPTESNCADTN